MAKVCDEAMMSVRVEELSPDEWQRLRHLRVASLIESPDSFGANLETEEMLTENEWRSKFDGQDHLVAVVDGKDVGVLSVENLVGDFGATCWIGGCWVHPDFRGQGVMRALVGYLDRHASERGWTVQGLGVFADNEEAITSYSRIGFERRGELQPSKRRPNRFYQRMIREVPKSP